MFDVTRDLIFGLEVILDGFLPLNLDFRVIFYIYPFAMTSIVKTETGGTLGRLYQIKLKCFYSTRIETHLLGSYWR